MQILVQYLARGYFAVQTAVDRHILGIPMDHICDLSGTERVSNHKATWALVVFFFSFLLFFFLVSH